MDFEVVSVAEQLNLCVPLKCDTAVTALTPNTRALGSPAGAFERRHENQLQ